MSSGLKTHIEVHQSQARLSWFQHGHKRTKTTVCDVTKCYKFKELEKEVRGTRERGRGKVCDLSTLEDPKEFDNSTQNPFYIAQTLWVYNVIVRSLILP